MKERASLTYNQNFHNNMNQIDVGLLQQKKSTNQSSRISSLEVWIFELELEQSEDCYAILDPFEKNRADAMRPSTRSIFITVHAVKRLILSSYLNTPPSIVKIVGQRFTKPALFDRSMGIDFSLSYNDQYAVMAVVKNCFTVGIDLEEAGQKFDFKKIVEGLFGPAEKAWFYRQPINMQMQRFLQCWTLKEAYLKAIGKGLSGCLREIECIGVEKNSIKTQLSEPGTSVWFSAEFFWDQQIISACMDFLPNSVCLKKLRLDHMIMSGNVLKHSNDEIANLVCQNFKTPHHKTKMRVRKINPAGTNDFCGNSFAKISKKTT